MSNFYLLILLLSLLCLTIYCSENDTNCTLPQGCRIDSFYMLQDRDLVFKEFYFSGNFSKGFICEVKSDNYRFDYKFRPSKNIQCEKNKPGYYSGSLELRFKKYEKIIIDERFNLQGVTDYMVDNMVIHDKDIQLHFTNLNGIDIQFEI